MSYVSVDNLADILAGIRNNMQTNVIEIKDIVTSEYPIMHSLVGTKYVKDVNDQYVKQEITVFKSVIQTAFDDSYQYTLTLDITDLVEGITSIEDAIPIAIYSDNVEQNNFNYGLSDTCVLRKINDDTKTVIQFGLATAYFGLHPAYLYNVQLFKRIFILL